MSKDNAGLRTLFWETTLNCNAYCPYCGSRCGRNNTQDVPGEFVIRTLKRIASAYDASKIMIDVTGGEPLLRKDLFSVMSAAVQLGFSWGMVTNGSLLTDEVIEELKKSGMRTISISVDDLFEKHDSVRGLPGGFAKIVRAIRRLADLQFLDHIQITTVVTKNNLHSLPEMYAYFSELPVDSWRLAPVDPIGRCREHKEILLDKDAFREFIDFMKEHVFSDRLSIMTSCSHYLGTDDTLFRKAPFFCGAGKSVASILADGSIFVCPDVPRRKELIQGNIRTDDFVACWENRFDVFRSSENRKTGRCAQCAEWEMCQGDSLHTWDFDCDSPLFCIKDFRDTSPVLNTLPEDIQKRILQKYPKLKGMKFSYGSSSDQMVVFTPPATDELYTLFHWGQRHPANLCEQLVAAVGCGEGRIRYVNGLIPLPLQNRSENFAFFTDELHQYALSELGLWNKNLDKTDTMLFGDSKTLRLLGYLHSHPGSLQVKMSQFDIELHHRMRHVVSSDYFTGILNPHTRDLGIYIDSIFRPNDVLLLMDENELEKWKDDLPVNVKQNNSGI